MERGGCIASPSSSERCFRASEGFQAGFAKSLSRAEGISGPPCALDAFSRRRVLAPFPSKTGTRAWPVSSSTTGTRRGCSEVPLGVSRACIHRTQAQQTTKSFLSLIAVADRRKVEASTHNPYMIRPALHLLNTTRCGGLGNTIDDVAADMRAPRRILAAGGRSRNHP